MKYFLIALIAAAFIISACSSKPSVIIREDQDGTAISVKKGDIFEVHLEAQLGTGYSWKLVSLPESVKSEGEPAQIKKGDKKAGASEYQVFRYRAEAAAETSLVFIYDRVWEKDKEPLKKITVYLHIK